jgi:hypothetical protein
LTGAAGTSGSGARRASRNVRVRARTSRARRSLSKYFERTRSWSRPPQLRALAEEETKRINEAYAYFRKRYGF